MRAFERQDGESTKAYAAFAVYRDLGPDRSLQKAAELYYGSVKNLAQVGRWSRRFSWVERARSFDDWREMLRREAIEKHERGKADDFARREVALKERALRLREIAADQAEKMLEWPLTEQRMVKDDDGEQVTYVFMPARWSKATAKSFYDMVIESSPQIEDNYEDFDFSELTDEELGTYIEMFEKLGVKYKSRD
jgi:hypothetical protein